MLNGKFNQIKFSKQDFHQAKILAENLKIPNNRKVICISCRDDAYLKKVEKMGELIFTRF